MQQKQSELERIERWALIILILELSSHAHTTHTFLFCFCFGGNVTQNHFNADIFLCTIIICPKQTFERYNFRRDHTTLANTHTHTPRAYQLIERQLTAIFAVTVSFFVLWFEFVAGVCLFHSIQSKVRQIIGKTFHTKHNKSERLDKLCHHRWNG